MHFKHFNRNILVSRLIPIRDVGVAVIIRVAKGEHVSYGVGISVHSLVMTEQHICQAGVCDGLLVFRK